MQPPLWYQVLITLFLHLFHLELTILIPAPSNYEAACKDNPAYYISGYFVKDDYAGLHFGTDDSRDAHATNGQYHVGVVIGWAGWTVAHPKIRTHRSKMGKNRVLTTRVGRKK